MEIDDIELDSETDSEVNSDDCDEDSIFEDNMSQCNALIDNDNALLGLGRRSQTMNQGTHCANNRSSESLTALAQIDIALSANKLLDEKMKRLERDLASRLNECREKLRVVQNSATHNDKNETFRYINCGRPYFKDSQNFAAPDNDDAKLAKSQMYDFSLVISSPGWTVKDKSQFVNMMHKMSIDIKKNELFKKIAILQRKSKSTKVEREIMDLRKEIDRVSKLPLYQVALPIDQEYDWDMLANKLNRRHTAQEYRSFWKLFFHPSISKSSWSKTEHAALQKVACQNGKQDWDKIACQLNTGRTGYQCFVYYRTNMTNSFTGKKWTPEEITYLKRLIEYYKEDFYIPWGKIAAAMENRTKIQIYNKYMRLIEQRKGRFLPEEDSVILNCVQRFGENFRRMTSYLPGRSCVQIRARYQVLNRMRVSTVWTVEDDKKLIQLMANQESNMNFSTAAQSFPNITRTKVRSRYITLLKWMKKYPNLDLEHAPRRGARRLNHGEASGNLIEAVENLKNSLITTCQKRAKKKKLSEQSEHRDLNDAIIVYLVNCILKERETESKKNPDANLILGPDHVVSKADLNITNLRKNIIFLNARLDESVYIDSVYEEDYPSLGDSNQDVSLVKMKSYSRKPHNQTTNIREPPNVWGMPTLFPGMQMHDQRKYVLPPQLATITGARAIMACVMSNGPYSESVNLHFLCRRNVLLKDLLEQVLERFYILFTWPLILSNELPNETTVTKLSPTDSVFIRPPILPTAPEVTINVKCMKKFKNADVTEVIDLDEDAVKDVEIAVKDKIDTDTDDKIGKLLC